MSRIFTAVILLFVFAPAVYGAELCSNVFAPTFALKTDSYFQDLIRLINAYDSVAVEEVPRRPPSEELRTQRREALDRLLNFASNGQRRILDDTISGRTLEFRAASVLSNLTEEEQDAIAKYSERWAYAINSYLRKGSSPVHFDRSDLQDFATNPESRAHHQLLTVIETIRILTQALPKLASYEGLVFRGGRMSQFVQDDSNNLLALGFTSTTVNYKTYSRSYTEGVNGRFDLFVIRSRTGKMLPRGLQGNGSEEEVLFPPGTRFRPIGSEVLTSGVQVHFLEEI